VLTAGCPVVEYEPGTWGPSVANEVVRGEDNWHDPVVEKTAPC
jgi:hypothetical protein